MLKTLLRETMDARSFPRLRDVAFRFFSELGAARLSYHHYPPLGAVDYTPKITVAAVGYPDEWIKIYMRDELYKRDPVVRFAATATRPFIWSEIGRLIELNSAERAYVSSTIKLVKGDGLAVPVFGPHGRNGYFGVGYLGQSCPTDVGIQADIQVGCQMVHLRSCELLQQALPNPPDLSTQERAVLNLVSRGKTNTAIAAELGVSKKTVATYIDRCFDKLDVNDRMTAALRALASGLLD